MSRYLKQKIRFHQERNQTRKTDNVTNKQKKTTRIHTLSNHSNWKIFEQTNQKKISQDKFTKKIIREIEKHFKMKIVKKLLLFQELIYVSSATRKKMIERHHDDTLTEYFEIDKMMKLIFRNYYFSQMR